MENTYELSESVEMSWDSSAFVNRIIAYWHDIEAIKHINTKFPTWDNIVNIYMRHFIENLSKRKTEEVQTELKRFWRSQIGHGFAQGEANYIALTSNKEKRALVGKICNKYLFRLSCYLGLSNIPCDEYGMSYKLSEPNKLLQAIEDSLGYEIITPSVAEGAIGIKVNNKTLHFREIEAAYAMERIRRELDKQEHFIEIGAGVGHVSFFVARELGLKTSVYDLPLVSIVSAFYLAGALGEENVAFCTEDKKDTLITIYPYWHFQKLENRQSLFVFNKDSFPEMGNVNISYYADVFETMRASKLLSINHETAKRTTNKNENMGVVSSVFNKRNSLKQVLRSPTWLRDCYIEECYRTN